MARHRKPAWSARRITDPAQGILEQMYDLASDRGLPVIDGSSLPPMFLWSLLHWERKVGLVALERVGVDRLALAKDVEDLLPGKATGRPIATDSDRNRVVWATGEPSEHGDVEPGLEPLLSCAEQESKDLGTDYVGTEHFVLAAIALADPALSAILRKHGIEHGNVREAAIEVLFADRPPFGSR